MQIVLQVLRHVAPTISIGLQNSKFLNCICSRDVSVRDGLLHVNVAISLAIDTVLQVIVHLICIVLHIQLALHLADIGFHEAHLLRQVRPLPINPVQLDQHQLQPLLQRQIVLLQRVQILVCGCSDWTYGVLAVCGEQAVSRVAKVDVAVRTARALIVFVAQRARGTF